jgi:predicted  nucleic acid-binding Zn-ribbon protein
MEQLNLCVKSLDEIKRQHDVWQQEHETWKQDISNWQREHDQILVLLHKLDCVIPDHGSAIVKHLDDIAAHERQLLECSEVLADQGAIERSEEYKLIREEHEHAASKHEEARRRHEGFRNMHRATLKEMRSLVEKLLPLC